MGNQDMHPGNWLPSNPEYRLAENRITQRFGC
jgi:hypothetical protein